MDCYLDHNYDALAESILCHSVRTSFWESLFVCNVLTVSSAKELWGAVANCGNSAHLARSPLKASSVTCTCMVIYVTNVIVTRVVRSIVSRHDWAQLVHSQYLYTPAFGIYSVLRTGMHCFPPM